MVEPHCSKCCPVQPPPPPKRPRWPFAAYLWVTLICLAIVGAWWFLVWLLHALLG